MTLNHNYLDTQVDALFERVAKWPSLAKVTPNGTSLTITEVKNPDRIFVADAERTFKSAANRKKFIDMVAHLTKEFKDYAQGLGYVTSFFLLTMSEPQTVELLAHMNASDSFIPGYWKAEAFKFATDAYVFLELLKIHHPDVAQHLIKNTVDPATFCQKWFVGLCVHVLPLEHLFEFFERFLQEGYPFLFKFGLSLVNTLKTQLLATNDVSTIFAILRLDRKTVHHEEKLFRDILDGTSNYDLSKIDFAEQRQQAYDKNLKKRVESAKAALDEVDEIEDCVLCKDDFPEVRCVECNIKVSI